MWRYMIGECLHRFKVMLESHGPLKGWNLDIVENPGCYLRMDATQFPSKFRYKGSSPDVMAL